MRHAPKPRQVLVLARESVLAALIGLLLELEQFEPVFPRPDERPEDAIARLRPPLVVMLDGEHACVRSDLFHARAAAAGARVVLFSEPLAADEVRAIAQRRRLTFLPMPAEGASLRRALDHAAAG